MKHIPTRVIAPTTIASIRPTRRALAKERTRSKVLAAARHLFSERGYEGATIRDIAKEAGMSTGAVFASFADKSELFDEILAADCLALAEKMAEAAEGADTPLAQLKAMFAAAGRFHLGQLPLAKAGFAAGWTRDAAAEKRHRDALKPVMAQVSGALHRAVEAGELPPKADLRLLAGLLWDVYLASYRSLALEVGLASDAADQLSARIGLIIAGAKA